MRTLPEAGAVVLLKLVLVPSLIALVSLAARRWGPRVSGLLVGLPLTSGPVILFLSVEQGSAFAARAAHGTLFGLVPLAAFCVTYAWVAQRYRWMTAALAGSGVFLVGVWLVKALTLPITATLGVVAVFLFLALAGLPTGVRLAQARTPPWWDIPLRMAAATVMVVGLTALARVVGPELAGVLAPFPVYAGVMAAFTHHFDGAGAAAQMVRGVVIGSFTFAVFFWILAGTLVPWGLGPAFGAAIVVAALLHSSLMLRFARRPGVSRPQGRARPREAS